MQLHYAVYHFRAIVVLLGIIVHLHL